MAKLILFIFFTVMVFAVLASAGTGNSATKKIKSETIRTTATANSVTQKIKSGTIRTIATALLVIVVLSLINSREHDDLLEAVFIEAVFILLGAVFILLGAVFMGIIIFFRLLLKWLFFSNTDDEN